MVLGSTRYAVSHVQDVKLAIVKPSIEKDILEMTNLEGRHVNGVEKTWSVQVKRRSNGKPLEC